MSRKISSGVRSLACLGTLLLMGCNQTPPSTYPVRGTVEVSNGEKLKTGIVEFTSEDGKHVARGNVQRDGSFVLTSKIPNDGAVLGKHRVIVQQLILTEKLALAQHGHGVTIDPKYGSYEKSGLEFVVEPRKNEFTIRVDARR